MLKENLRVTQHEQRISDDTHSLLFMLYVALLIYCNNGKSLSTIKQNFLWTTSSLTHWGRVMHISVSELTVIGSDNGLSPGRRQAIIWTNAGILLIGPLWTNVSEIYIEIPIFSFKKMRLKESSAKWRPCCLGLNVLRKCLIW